MDVEWISDLLELENSNLGYRAMMFRAVIVFCAVLAIVRIGARRFISKLSAFDMLVAIMIGSIGSRAITGNSSFGPSLASIAGLVFMHWFFSFICYRTEHFGQWLKGYARQLVKDGELQHDQMRKTNITRRDLEEALRSQGLRGGVEDIRDAWQERDGSISVFTASKGEKSSRTR